MTKSKGKIKNRKKIKLSETHKESIKKSMKGKHKGKDNPAWKGGKSRKYSQTLKKTLPQVCVVCGSNENLEIHHKDRNPENNELSNLEILCRYHHKIEHIAHLIPFQYKKGENNHTRK